MKALITRKLGMTSTIADDGKVQAVTILASNPNVITQLKNMDNDGYVAVQLGCEITKPSNVKKAQAGHLKTIGIMTKIAREVRIPKITEDLKVGEKINAEVFSVGDIVTVSGVSKGKGWAGTIKRHNFHRGRKTHGGCSYRRPGSIGSMYPQKIFKGKKMAGHMGTDHVTIKNQMIAFIDNENSVIGITGTVPGPRKGIVIVRGAN